MKTYNKTILTSVLILLAILPIIGQEKTTQDLLMSKDWNRTINQSMSDGFEFTNTEITEYILYKGEKISKAYPYYLSEKIENKFDYSKIGKTRNGKYLNFFLPHKNKEKEKIITYEILELSDSIFKIRKPNEKIPSKAIYQWVAKPKN